MTTEELLKPRYKVVADYPNCPWNIGRILTCLNNEWDCLDAPASQKVRNIENYPAIFKKLEWWEERSIKDLPEYVKRFDTIFKAKWIWSTQDKIFLAKNGHLNNDLVPSTKEEYELQLKK